MEFASTVCGLALEQGPVHACPEIDRPSRAASPSSQREEAFARYIYPRYSGNGWEATVKNDSGTKVMLSVTAYCLEA
jgi:hypothetical protein